MEKYKKKLLSRLKKTGFKTIRALIQGSRLLLIRLCSTSPFTASIYYFFFSAAFRREQFATLNAIRAYYRELKDRGSKYLLKRNVHRIEKGLIMRPRKEVFAIDYIKETVDCYCLLKNEELDESMIEWASDVLAEYFSSIKKNAFLHKLEAKFQRYYSPKNQHERQLKVPYCRNFSTEVPSYEALLELSIRRRSVRWYKNIPIPRNLIDKALLIANYSPSACNRQPFTFKIFDDPDLVRQIATLPMGTPGYAHNIPVIVVITGQLDAYYSERDRHLIYIDASLAAMSFMYALETLGLSSCTINWPDVEKLELKMGNLLNLRNTERPIMLISIGYPDPEGKVPYSQKNNLDSIRTYNE